MFQIQGYNFVYAHSSMWKPFSQLLRNKITVVFSFDKNKINVVIINNNKHPASALLSNFKKQCFRSTGSMLVTFFFTGILKTNQLKRRNGEDLPQTKVIFGEPAISGPWHCKSLTDKAIYDNFTYTTTHVTIYHVHTKH